LAKNLFFKLVRAIEKCYRKPISTIFKGVFDQTKLFNVHLSDQQLLEAVRFVGLIEPNNLGSNSFPYEINKLLVFESDAGKRLMIRPSTIVMIEEFDSPTTSSPNTKH